MKTKDWVLFWLVGLIWGTSFLWIKIALEDVSPIMLVGFRTLFGSLGLCIIIAFNKSAHVPWQDLKKHLLDFVILGFINIAIPWMLISWAEQFIDSGTAAILNGTVPLFTIVISPIFIEDDHITIPKLSGLAIGFIGVVLLMLPSIQDGWNDNLIGQAVFLLATLSYAVSTVFARKRMHNLPSQLQAFLQLIAGMTIIWSIALFTERPMVFPQLPITRLALLWLGLLGSSAAYLIYFSLLHKMGPTRVATVTYIPPLVGVILGAVFLGEVFYWQTLLGAALILSGITIVNIKKKQAAT